MKVTLECCAVAGRAVEKFLPTNLKPAIRDVIDEGLGIKTQEGRASTSVGGTNAPPVVARRAAPAQKPQPAARQQQSSPKRDAGGYGGGQQHNNNAPPHGARAESRDCGAGSVSWEEPPGRRGGGD